jgi:hypothetical protein
MMMMMMMMICIKTENSTLSDYQLHMQSFIHLYVFQVGEQYLVKHTVFD